MSAAGSFPVLQHEGRTASTATTRDTEDTFDDDDDLVALAKRGGFDLKAVLSGCRKAREEVKDQLIQCLTVGESPGLKNLDQLSRLEISRLAVALEDDNEVDTESEGSSQAESKQPLPAAGLVAPVKEHSVTEPPANEVELPLADPIDIVTSGTEKRIGCAGRSNTTRTEAEARKHRIKMRKHLAQQLFCGDCPKVGQMSRLQICKMLLALEHRKENEQRAGGHTSSWSSASYGDLCASEIASQSSQERTDPFAGLVSWPSSSSRPVTGDQD